MGCTASAPTALDPRAVTAAAADAATPSAAVPTEVSVSADGRGGGGVAGSQACEMTEPQGGAAAVAAAGNAAAAAARAERVLPASDTVESIGVDVDSSNESVTTTTPDDVQVIDLETDSPPPMEAVTDSHVARAAREPLTAAPPPPSEGAAGSPPRELAPAMTGDNTLELPDDAEQEPALAETPPLEEEWSSVAGWLERRATRWEALADVAAELPPKLTVDPLTGQIYAFAKRD